jgi:hypothetical protein
LWRGIDATKTNISTLFMKHLVEFEKNVSVPCLKAISSDPNETHDDYTIFEGASGYLYLYIRLYRFFKALAPEDLDKMKQVYKEGDEHFYRLTDSKLYLEKAMKQYEALLPYIVKKKEKKTMISFCMSKASVYLCGAHLCCLTNNPKMFKDNVDEILKYHSTIMASPNSW